MLELWSALCNDAWCTLQVYVLNNEETTELLFKIEDTFKALEFHQEGTFKNIPVWIDSHVFGKQKRPTCQIYWLQNGTL